MPALAVLFIIFSYISLRKSIHFFLLTRQATIMAFQFGAGFTDIIAPPSGVLMGVPGMARVHCVKWLKWIMPVLTILVALGFLLLIPTVTMKLSGF